MPAACQKTAGGADLSTMAAQARIVAIETDIMKLDCRCDRQRGPANYCSAAAAWTVGGKALATYNGELARHEIDMYRRTS